MTAVDWAVAALLVLQPVAVIFQIGKPGTPITPGVAATCVLIDFALILWIALS